jgi:hypothetical protein
MSLIFIVSDAGVSVVVTSAEVWEELRSVVRSTEVSEYKNEALDDQEGVDGGDDEEDESSGLFEQS